MIKIIALSALSLALISCASQPDGQVKTVEAPAPEAKDVRLCAGIRPTSTLPKTAGLVAPVGSIEAAAVAAFLNAVADLIDHDKEMTARAMLAKSEMCAKLK